MTDAPLEDCHIRNADSEMRNARVKDRIPGPMSGTRSSGQTAHENTCYAVLRSRKTRTLFALRVRTSSEQPKAPAKLLSLESTPFLVSSSDRKPLRAKRVHHRSAGRQGADKDSASAHCAQCLEVAAQYAVSAMASLPTFCQNVLNVSKNVANR